MFVSATKNGRGVVFMSIEELTKQFILTKEHDPLDSNELLDFLQVLYIQNKLSIIHYRRLYQELDACGAVKPDYYLDQELTAKSM